MRGRWWGEGEGGTTVRGEGGTTVGVSARGRGPSGAGPCGHQPRRALALRRFRGRIEPGRQDDAAGDQRERAADGRCDGFPGDGGDDRGDGSLGRGDGCDHTHSPSRSPAYSSRARPRCPGTDQEEPERRTWVESHGRGEHERRHDHEPDRHDPGKREPGADEPARLRRRHGGHGPAEGRSSPPRIAMVVSLTGACQSSRSRARSSRAGHRRVPGARSGPGSASASTSLPACSWWCAATVSSCTTDPVVACSSTHRAAGTSHVLCQRIEPARVCRPRLFERRPRHVDRFQVVAGSREAAVRLGEVGQRHPGALVQAQANEVADVLGEVAPDPPGELRLCARHAADRGDHEGGRVEHRPE